MAIKESLEMLQIIEEHDFEDKKYINGEKIGMVNIAFGSILYRLRVNENGLRFFPKDKDHK
ncbi:hypothetical protein Ddye_019041 [Dipteronia dyeriana]|uniref:Uncharacterized protein n=1 Tax=Dipteronia dyeriana TaxID=168575 RepID=A0AAD9WUN7_9ROSI|nr:hypothetical protein Ddye_019041 [Dipteronia dyeriana]